MKNIDRKQALKEARRTLLFTEVFDLPEHGIVRIKPLQDNRLSVESTDGWSGHYSWGRYQGGKLSLVLAAYVHTEAPPPIRLSVKSADVGDIKQLQAEYAAPQAVL